MSVFAVWKDTLHVIDVLVISKTDTILQIVNRFFNNVFVVQNSFILPYLSVQCILVKKMCEVPKAFRRF